MKVNHVNPNIVKKIITELEKELELLIIQNRLKNTYLGINIGFFIKGKVVIDMEEYMKQMVNNFKSNFKQVISPARNNLYKIDKESEKLLARKEEDKGLQSRVKEDIFHTF